MRVEPQAAFLTVNTCLEIEKVASIHHRLCMERQPEVRKALRDKDTQARVIDREPAVERVNGKNGRLRRKPENGLNVRTGLQISLELTEERLEDVILEQLGRIRDRF